MVERRRAADAASVGTMPFNGAAGQSQDEALRAANDAARESKAVTSAVLESALDCIITIDHEGRVIEFNPAAERTFGYRRDDVIGADLAELIVPPALRDAHRRALSRWTADGPLEGAGRQLGKRIELTALRSDGTEFPIEIAITRLDLPGPPLFTASIRDISERRRIEEQLSRAELRYRTLVEHLPLITYVDSAADGPSPPLYLSPQVEEILGYSREEWLERPGIYGRSLHPDDRDWVLEAKRRSYESGEPLRCEYRIIKADGSMIWILDESMVHPTGADGEVRQGFAIDITKRKLAEAALHRAEAEYRTLVEQLPLVVYLESLEPEGEKRYVSPQIESLLGYTTQEWLTQDLFAKAIHPEDREAVLSRHAVSRRSGEPLRIEYRLVGRDGRVVWVRDDAVVATAGADGASFLQGCLLDITERKTAEEQLRHQAFHDALTGLPNRALFTDRVQHALARRPRHATGMGVLFLDLDDFKTVNDSLGHLAGDELLRGVAARLLEAVRAGDSVARFGGDEFAVLLEEIGEPADAARAADRICEVLAAPFSVAGREVFVTASIGIALSGDAEELLRGADVAMYRAKSSPATRYAFFEPEMDNSVLERLALVAALRRSSLNEEFVLHYQPVVDLRVGRVVGLEALLRWDRPGHGLVAPLDFIPVAEETGLIVEIGRWVLSEACSQAARWQERFPSRPALSMSVNVSARQLQHPSLVGDVASALAAARLKPDSLVLEITESVLVQSGDTGIEALHALKDLGVVLALDDFGTGYSSLWYLESLPVEVVKIDRSFVQKVGRGARHLALARGIIDLGQALGLQVIAEGIEQPAQTDALRRMGCTVGQGFLFAKPLDTSGIEALLELGGDVLADPASRHRDAA